MIIIFIIITFLVVIVITFLFIIIIIIIIIIVFKVEGADAGRYQCEMKNQLGSSLEASFLTVQGGEVRAPPP